MSDLTVTSTNVGIVFPSDAIVRDFVAAVDITAGAAVYINAAGKVALTDANASSPANRFRGIALKSVGAGQSVSVLQDGEVFGFDLSGLAYDDKVYASDTAGKLATAASETTSLLAGVVVPLSNKDLTKVLKITGFAG
jgi:hypothetical protein